MAPRKASERTLLPAVQPPPTRRNPHSVLAGYRHPDCATASFPRQIDSPIISFVVRRSRRNCWDAARGSADRRFQLPAWHGSSASKKIPNMGPFREMATASILGPAYFPIAYKCVGVATYSVPLAATGVE